MRALTILRSASAYEEKDEIRKLPSTIRYLYHCSGWVDMFDLWTLSSSISEYLVRMVSVVRVV